MPVTIEIPTAFRRFTNGAPKVDCCAATVAEALNELTSASPISAATSATTRARSASSSTSISTKKTSASSAANPAPSRKVIASSSSPPSPEAANHIHRRSMAGAESTATFRARRCSISMRPRLLIYALASLLLLAFHAPVRAVASLFSDWREL